MGRREIPALNGVLSGEQVAQTAAYLADVQDPSGAVPWYPGGQLDVWDHVECAMALLVGGQTEAAERAYAWSIDVQRDDGSWPMKMSRGLVEDPATDTNMCAYLAVGVWHHWLVQQNTVFVQGAWPAVRRALDFVTGMQLPFGGIAWARGKRGTAAVTALLAGSSSIYHALSCGIALAALVGEPQPEWELAAGRLGHALRDHQDRFESKARFSMDWYYPVLGGAVRGRTARVRLDSRWDEFVVPGLGTRCVADRPWVTGAETCELVLALDAVGEKDRAHALLSDMQHLRDPHGSYWTGFVVADGVRWPHEQSTWTAAAVILAVDALSRSTPGSDIFRGNSLDLDFAEIGLRCGCRDEDSTDRIASHAADPGEDAQRAQGAGLDEISTLDSA